MWQTACGIGRGMYYCLVALTIPFAMLLVIPYLSIKLMIGFGKLANGLVNGR